MAGSIDGVAVFSATTKFQRDCLGQDVTTWLRARPDAEVVAYEVTQSSDASHHCLSILLMWRNVRPDKVNRRRMP